MKNSGYVDAEYRVGVVECGEGVLAVQVTDGKGSVRVRGGVGWAGTLL